MYTRSNNLAAVCSAVLQIIQQRASLSQRLEQTVRVVMATGFSSGPKRDGIYFFLLFHCECSRRAKNNAICHRVVKDTQLSS